MGLHHEAEGVECQPFSWSWANRLTCHCESAHVLEIYQDQEGFYIFEVWVFRVLIELWTNILGSNFRREYFLTTECVCNSANLSDIVEDDILESTIHSSEM